MMIDHLRTAASSAHLLYTKTYTQTLPHSQEQKRKLNIRIYQQTLVYL